MHTSFLQQQQKNSLLRQLLLQFDLTPLALGGNWVLEGIKTKSLFLANMSHELRTPLNAVMGYSELLIEEAEDDENLALKNDLTKIHTAGRHLLELINDILDLSKIEAGKMEVYLERFSLASIFREIKQTMQPLVHTNNNALGIKLDVEQDLILNDKQKIKQIIYNLVSNSCKFTENGKIEIHVCRDPLSHQLTISVSDTGIGINKETLDRYNGDVTRAMADFTLNSIIGTIEISKLFTGDPAAYAEKGGNLFVDYLKRIPAITASGYTARVHGDVKAKYKSAVVRDIYKKSTYFIDEKTGLFSWIDPIFGDYVFAYEIEEYRNGQLIGVSVADFPVFIKRGNKYKGSFSDVNGITEGSFNFNSAKSFNLFASSKSSLILFSRLSRLLLIFGR